MKFEEDRDLISSDHPETNSVPDLAWTLISWTEPKSRDEGSAWNKAWVNYDIMLSATMTINIFLFQPLRIIKNGKLEIHQDTRNQGLQENITNILIKKLFYNLLFWLIRHNWQITRNVWNILSSNLINHELIYNVYYNVHNLATSRRKG